MRLGHIAQHAACAYVSSSSQGFCVCCRQRKGDVFHLLLNLAIVLDERVWPKEDEEEVKLLTSLVHHVTGVSPELLILTKSCCLTMTISQSMTI